MFLGIHVYIHLHTFVYEQIMYVCISIVLDTNLYVHESNLQCK